MSVRFCIMCRKSVITVQIVYKPLSLFDFREHKKNDVTEIECKGIIFLTDINK